MLTLSQLELMQLYTMLTPTDLSRLTPALRQKLRNAFKELEEPPTHKFASEEEAQTTVVDAFEISY